MARKTKKEAFKARKDLLASLMANEGLRVVIDPTATTACIIAETKTIILPEYAIDDENVYDMFQAHEVSHALHSPMKNVHEVLTDPKRPGFQGFINATEDARIEKLIQNKFPGLRPIFTKGYLKLVQDKWFGEDVETAELSLIDKINIFAKTRGLIPQDFSDPVEKTFLDRTLATQTFDEALRVAQDIYDHMRDQLTQEPPQEPDKSPGQGEESDDGENQDSDTSGEESQDNGSETSENTEENSSEDGDGGSQDTEEGQDEDTDKQDGSEAGKDDGDEGQDGEEDDSGTSGDDEAEGKGGQEDDGEGAGTDEQQSGNSKGDTSDTGEAGEDEDNSSEQGSPAGDKGQENKTDQVPQCTTDEEFRRNENALADKTQLQSQRLIHWSHNIPTVDLKKTVVGWRDADKAIEQIFSETVKAGQKTNELFNEKYMKKFNKRFKK